MSAMTGTRVLSLCWCAAVCSAARVSRSQDGRDLARTTYRQLSEWLLDDDDGSWEDTPRRSRGVAGEWVERGDEEIVYTVHREHKRSLVRLAEQDDVGDLALDPEGRFLVDYRPAGSRQSSLSGGQTPSNSPAASSGMQDSVAPPRQHRRRHSYHGLQGHNLGDPARMSLRSLSTLAESFAELLDDLAKNDDPQEDEEEVLAARKKLKKRGLKKYLLPLLLAYKLKFFALVPLMLGGLVLMVGSTGMAGFFFALFAAVMTLRAGHHHA